MSDGLLCDNCNAVLIVDSRGDDLYGEREGWVSLTLGSGKLSFDACTRTCAIALLEREDVVEAHDAWLAQIADIARTIADGSTDAN